METWQEKTAAYRAQALRNIPQAWLLPERYSHLLANQNSSLASHNSSVPILSPSSSLLSILAESEILTPSELTITESYSAVPLASALAAGELKAVDVTTAFCKRAAVVQQLVNCLTETMFDAAMIRARELYEFLEREGRVMGPLHGVPVSLKVCFHEDMSWGGLKADADG